MGNYCLENAAQENNADTFLVAVLRKDRKIANGPTKKRPAETSFFNEQPSQLLQTHHEHVELHKIISSKIPF